MPFLPPRIPEVGQWAKLCRWLNQLRDYVQTLKPAMTLDTLVSHTSSGVTRQPLGGEGKGADVQWRGEWDATTAYAVNDIFIYGSNNSPGYSGYSAILRDGTKASTYIVKQACPAGTIPNLASVNAGYFDVLARGSWDILKIVTGDAYLQVDTTQTITLDSVSYKDPTLTLRNNEVSVELKPSQLRDQHDVWHDIQFRETNICWEDPITGIKSTMAVMLPRSKVYDPSTGEDVEQ